MSKMKYLSCWMELLAITVLFLAITPQPIAGTPAQDICGRLYGRVPDGGGTLFLNNRCQVQCKYGNQLRKAAIHEGQTCPPGSTNHYYACRSGRCEPRERRTSPYVTPPPYDSGPLTSPTGRLEIMATRVERLPFSEDLSTYLTICVLNNHNHPVDRLPLTDDYWRFRCHSCSSEVVRSKNPYWTTPCKQTDKYDIHKDSRIIFELWEENGSRFLGGAQFGLLDIIKNKSVHFTQPLSDGATSGALLTTTIDWNN